MTLPGLYLISELALLKKISEKATSCAFRGRAIIKGLFLAPRILLSVCGMLMVASLASAQQQPPSKDLSERSLDELSNIEVTSVSKKEQSLFQTAAAVHVITQEDIRRSGSSTIADILRVVPGLEVARINSNTWAITARGFNGRFANKMLVLVDGRSVYSQEFSGVYWELQDMMLEDIERIEIIRGPGATIWGANAVNGVINIITKRASSTQGGLVTARTGNEDQGIGAIRYGGKIGEKTFYRVYTKYTDRTGQFSPAGNDIEGPWHSLRGGFRLDWQANKRDSLTVQGDIYRNNSHNNGPTLSSGPVFALSNSQANVDSSGGDVLITWDRVISAKSDFKVQYYYDRTKRNDGRIDDGRNVFDFDFSHHIIFGDRHDIVWGGGYRYTSDNIFGSFDANFVPGQVAQHFLNAFAQDEITVIPDRLHITVGAKIERSTFAQLSVQPSIRAAWTVSDRQTIWAAVSEADRLPNRSDRGIVAHVAAFPARNNLTGVLTVLGNQMAQSEEMLAYEGGYRVQANHRLSLDFVGFYNVYNKLKSSEPLQPFVETNPFPPHLIIPVQSDNKLRGKSYGTEVSANWNVLSRWKLTAGYTYLKLNLHPEETSKDVVTGPKTEGTNPRNQFQIQSNLFLAHKLEFNTSVYYVSKLVYSGIPAYTRIDAQLNWRLSDSFDFGIGGQNLLNASHQEFGDVEAMTASLVKRTAFGKLTWRF
jgi:iron complex outermembrane receptor protein